VLRVDPTLSVKDSFHYRGRIFIAGVVDSIGVVEVLRTPNGERICRSQSAKILPIAILGESAENEVLVVDAQGLVAGFDGENCVWKWRHAVLGRNATAVSAVRNDHLIFVAGRVPLKDSLLSEYGIVVFDPAMRERTRFTYFGPVQDASLIRGMSGVYAYGAAQYRKCTVAALNRMKEFDVQIPCFGAAAEAFGAIFFEVPGTGLVVFDLISKTVSTLEGSHTIGSTRCPRFYRTLGNFAHIVDTLFYVGRDANSLFVLEIRPSATNFVVRRHSLKAIPRSFQVCGLEVINRSLFVLPEASSSLAVVDTENGKVDVVNMGSPIKAVVSDGKDSVYVLQ
jgi:hypothetical protein